MEIINIYWHMSKELSLVHKCILWRPKFISVVMVHFGFCAD